MADRTVDPPAVLRHLEVLPQGVGAAGDGLAVLRAGAADRVRVVLLDRAADPGADELPAAAGHGGRHPRRRAAVRAGRVRDRARRRRLGLGLRRARLEPHPVGGDAGRADADLRVLHGGAGHRDRPALRAERDTVALLLGVLPPQPPARRRGVLRDAAGRHRPGADREPGIDARVRDDRRGAPVRALGSVDGAVPVGLDDEAVPALRRVPQRARGAVGSGEQPHGRVGGDRARAGCW